MKEGWTYKKLGEVCKVTMGQSPNGNSVNDTNGIEFHQGKVFFGEKYLNVSNSFTEQPSKIAEPNSVLLCVRAPVGTVNITPRRICIGRGLCSIKPNDIIIMPFLFYALTQKQAYFDKNSTGSTFKAISSKVVINTVLPIPPLAEQERIVAELDLLSSIIDKKKAQLKELDQLAQSIFYTMFGDPITNEKGWEVKKLGESVHEMFLGPFGSSLKVDSYVAKEESYCMVYEQKHAIQGTISLDNHYINKDKYESLKRFEVKPNDFIMSCRGTIGRLFQLPHNAPLGIIHPSLMKIRIKDEVYNAAYFQFMLVKIVANENTNGNCVQMAITAKQLSKKELTIPPLPLQQEFADKIEAIERQKSLIQQSIVETQTLFDSRMDYWFG